jgi:4-amino-4-deoxychorismate lyase
VKSLQIVHIRELDYAHKYANRQALQTLFSERSCGDDVLLLRDGLLTDTSYANVALFDGQQWYTPARPLLRGTARARYLKEGILREADIRLEELRHFQKLKLINAMMNWEEGPVVDTEKIMAI